MRSNLRIFLVGGLLVAIGLAMLVSGFASSSPDGLNKVAEDHGFAANAKQHLFENGPATRSRVCTTTGSAPASPG
jgi:cobalt/nickel transport protein